MSSPAYRAALLSQFSDSEYNRAMSIHRYEPEVDADSDFELYGAVNWLAYTSNPEKLKAALDGSSLVLTYKTEGKVVGLARCVTD